MDYLRVSGVYDYPTIELLQELGIQSFAFDCRPRSFNFLQGHQIKKILTKTYQTTNQFSLMFCNEKEFVINGVVEELLLNDERFKNILSLELIDDSPMDYYERLVQPFIWHYRSHVPLEKMLENPYLKTIVIDQQHISQLDLSFNLFPFMERLFKMLPPRINVELQLSWKAPVMETLLDFFPIAGLCFQVDNHVELSYRNVNLNAIRQHLEYTKESLNF